MPMDRPQKARMTLQEARKMALEALYEAEMRRRATANAEAIREAALWADMTPLNSQGGTEASDGQRMEQYEDDAVIS